MHAFVRAVLLRRGGPNSLMLDAETQPPHVELREAMETAARKRHPVIRPNGAWQPIVAKEPIEDRAGSVAVDRQQSVAREEIPTMEVRDRQGVAIDAVARAELPLEVGGPQIIRGLSRRRDDTRMAVRPASAPRMGPLIGAKAFTP